MSGRARPVAAPAPLMPLVDRVRAEIRILRTIVEYQNMLDVNVLQAGANEACLRRARNIRALGENLFDSGADLYEDPQPFARRAGHR